MAAIFFFSSLPRPLAPLGKVGASSGVGTSLHFGEYAVLAVLLLRALRNARRRLLTVAAVGSIYAVLDELHQRFVPGRHFQWGDIAFDVLGVLAGLLLAAWFCGRKVVNSPEPI